MEHTKKTGNIHRIYTVNDYLRQQFGRKMVKLAIDGGFTCPNRDGTRGTGGCLFCGSGGGGDFASTIEDQIRLMSEKWPDAGYLAYFQNHTNTYAPVTVLREKYEAALADPNISGIVIATRPDCLPDDVLDLLDQLNREHFMWVELGLQTMHDTTAKLINRCYDLTVYDQAMADLSSRSIKTVVHLILGLPGESREDMLESVRYVCASGAWGIKFHLLNVVSGSGMAELYHDYQPFADIDEYVQLVCDILELLPPQMVVHRMTGDAPRKTLIAPSWSYRKRTILNEISAELRRRGTYQGFRY
jgi:radical SAM protein (TIGR01212 family)